MFLVDPVHILNPRYHIQGQIFENSHIPNIELVISWSPKTEFL
jgi:hypothetical protein